MTNREQINHMSNADFARYMHKTLFDNVREFTGKYEVTSSDITKYLDSSTDIDPDTRIIPLTITANNAIDIIMHHHIGEVEVTDDTIEVGDMITFRLAEYDRDAHFIIYDRFAVNDKKYVVKNGITKTVIEVVNWGRRGFV